MNPRFLLVTALTCAFCLPQAHASIKCEKKKNADGTETRICQKTEDPNPSPSTGPGPTANLNAKSNANPNLPEAGPRPAPRPIQPVSKAIQGEYETATQPPSGPNFFPDHSPPAPAGASPGVPGAPPPLRGGGTGGMGGSK